MAEPFRIALNTAGAVSARAYTAGVLDLQVEALNAPPTAQRRPRRPRFRQLWTAGGYS